MAFGFTSGGLAGAFGHPEVSQYIDPRRNMLLGLAAGLVGGPNWSQGLSSGFQMAAQGGAVDRAAAEKAKADELAAKQTAAARDWFQKNAPQYLPMIEAGMSVGDAWNRYFAEQNQKTVNPYQERQQLAQQYGLQGNDLTEYVLTGDLPSGRGAASEVSLQPTWMLGPDGKPVLGQMTKGGEVIASQLPEGMSVMDPLTMAGGKTGATVDAKTAGAARAALPGAEQANNITKNAIAKIRAEASGMSEWFGQIGPRGIYVNPGSQMGNFQTVATQANAGAFMQARNMLKGGGQITDYEGRRGEDAYSRMEMALQRGDQAAYLSALSDFEAAVADGYAKLLATAQGAYSQGSPAVVNGAGGGVDDILSKYGL